jgi:GDPmannose 4,6-dehydratase
MARMLDLETPEDFVIASGETRTLEDFVAAVFACLGRDWRNHVIDNPALHRPTDIMYSGGNPAKAARLLGWKAEKKMAAVVNLLVEAEMQRVAEEAGEPKGSGGEVIRRTA